MTTDTKQQPLVCPACKHSFPYNDDKIAGKGSSFQMTHDARPIFCDDSCLCANCQKQNNAQPMVNLTCGHVLCQNDFTKLGGQVKQLSEPSRGNPALARPFSSSSRSNTNSSRSNRDADDIAGDELRALSEMRDFPRELFRMFPNRPESAAVAGYALAGGPFINYSNDNDDESEDDDDDDELPPLIAPDGTIVRSPENTDDYDDDFPPLVPRNVD